MNKRNFLRLLEPCTIHDYPELERRDGRNWGEIILHPKASMVDPVKIHRVNMFVNNKPNNTAKRRLHLGWLRYNKWLLGWYKTMSLGLAPCETEFRTSLRARGHTEAIIDETLEQLNQQEGVDIHAAGHS